jgi:hypothetical protein
VQVYQLQYAVYQRVIAQIGELAEIHKPTEMLVAIGITSRTVQRALARDFDGEQWGLAT